MAPDITIRRAVAADVPAIQRVAHRSWHVTYGDLLEDDAIDKMGAQGYSEGFLERTLDAGNVDPLCGHRVRSERLPRTALSDRPNSYTPATRLFQHG